MKSRYPLTMLSGILIGTSYIPFPPWAIFFAFIPLWWTWLREDRALNVFFTGWLAQFLLSLIGFNWVAHTVHEFGHLPWPVAILVLFGYCGISTLSIPVFGVLWFYYARYFRLSQTARILALPVFLAIGQRTFPMIFDWHFGYTWLWAKIPAYQIADTIGFIGLADIGLLFNALLLLALKRYQSQQSAWPWVATVLVSFALMNMAGAWRLHELPKPDALKKFLVVQANIDNEEKLYAEQGAAFRDTVLNRFFDLTATGVHENQGGVDFAVWPETAFPDMIDTPDLSQPYATKLRQKIIELKTKMIVGAYSHTTDTHRMTNSFFVLGDGGQWLTPPYHKTMLLAFGEYFPLADYFPKLRAMFPEVADFGRGPGPTVLRAGELAIGAQICYEGLFDWFTRGLANRGAQVIVNLTNDSWYGPEQEPFQHGWMTLARAVEVRRPLVRSTNTGISMAILASGEILPLSPVQKAWQHVFEVPYLLQPPTTPFMGWGFWLIPTLLGLTLLALPFTKNTQ